MNQSRCRDFQLSIDKQGVCKVWRPSGKFYLAMMRPVDYLPYKGRLLRNRCRSHQGAEDYREAVRVRLIRFVAHEPLLKRRTFDGQAV